MAIQVESQEVSELTESRHVKPYPVGTKVYRTGYRVVFHRINLEWPCQEVYVRQYWHEKSPGAYWTDLKGQRQAQHRLGPSVYPDYVVDKKWKWSPGEDGFITDSHTVDPNWDAAKIACDDVYRTLTWRDHPEIILPQEIGDNGPWGIEYFFKTDLLAGPDVVDNVYWHMKLEWCPTDSGGLAQTAAEFHIGDQIPRLPD